MAIWPETAPRKLMCAMVVESPDTSRGIARKPPRPKRDQMTTATPTRIATDVERKDTLPETARKTQMHAMVVERQATSRGTARKVDPEEEAEEGVTATRRRLATTVATPDTRNATAPP